MKMNDVKYQSENVKAPFYKKDFDSNIVSVVLNLIGILLFFIPQFIFSAKYLQSISQQFFFFEDWLFLAAFIFAVFGLKKNKMMSTMLIILSVIFFVIASMYLLGAIISPI